jgi:hypothetical protein
MALIRSLLLIAASLGSTSAADFCAVDVRVTDESGELLSNILVQLVATDGKVESEQRTRAGIVQFCDFSFGPHSIRVGEDSCFPVTVEGVRAYFGTEYTIPVIKMGCPHAMGTVACKTYIRVKSSAGPLQNARASFEGVDVSFSADRYGRIQGASLLPGMKTRMTVSAAGYETQILSVGCETSEDIERVVILKPNGQK